MSIPEGVLTRLRNALLRRHLKGQTFSVISNNCWGAHIYQRLGREYTTPFVGLFLTPASYLALLSNFDSNIARPLRFKESSQEQWVNQLRSAKSRYWPIGYLAEDVEIQFMHYQSAQEALQKWERRKTRMSSDPQTWRVKFCDRDGCTDGQMAAFDALPFQSKVLFTVRCQSALHSAVSIPWHEPTVPDGVVLSSISPRYFNTANWIKGGATRPTALSQWLNL